MGIKGLAICELKQWLLSLFEHSVCVGDSETLNALINQGIKASCYSLGRESKNHTGLCFEEGYIMRSVGLGELQAGLKIGRRNINNLRYADDTALVAESEEELKSLLMRVKQESERVGLKLRSWHPTPWQIEGEKV